jgi:hypothetical protein
MKKAFGILVPLTLWTPLLFAQVKFMATVNKTSVSVGERFEVKFSINAYAEEFTSPDLNAFQVLEGPNTLMNQMVNNGDTTFYTTYSCILVAKKEGTFEIGAAVLVSAQNVFSNSLKINVKGQFPANQQQLFKVHDFYTADDSSQSAPADIKTLPKYIFIRAEADKTHAYVGEQIKVTYKLYSSVNIESNQLDKEPELKGFRYHGVANPDRQNIPWITENLNGKEYNVCVIKQLVVAPQYAGNLTITPLTLLTILQIPDKGALDNTSGNYHHLKYELKSAAVVIHAIARRSK